MSKHGNPKNSNGGRHSPPPPPPVARTVRGSTPAFGELLMPRRPEPKPPGQQIERVPDRAKITASIARPVPPEVAALQAGRNAKENEDAPYVPGNTLMPAPMKPSHVPSPEAAKKAAENEEKHLMFANALYRASEIMGEDWANWIAEPALLRENVANAVEYLKEKRTENEVYASDYKMLRAFSGMISTDKILEDERVVSKDERLNDYLVWIQGKENRFLEMAHVYASISMGPLTPYSEVVGACREMAHCDGPGQADKGVVGFLAMVGDTEEYKGSAYLKGEMYKRMFDSWYLRKAARAMVEVHDSARIAAEREGALLRVGALSKELGALAEENKRLRAASGSNIPPQVMEEVHSLRGEMLALDADKGSLESTLRQVRDAYAELSEENIELTRDLASANANASSLEAELAKEKEDSKELMDRIRVLTAQNDSLEKRMAEMEARLNKLDSLNMELREKNAELSEELELAREPDLPGRPTVFSGEFPVPEEVEASVAEMEERAPEEQEGIARLVSATREREKPVVGGAAAAVAPRIPAGEVTETIALEEMEELKAREPVFSDREYWGGNKLKRAVYAIVGHGILGRDELVAMPKDPQVSEVRGVHETEEEHAKNVEAWRKYREQRYEALELYNQAGRGIRKTLEAGSRNWKKVTAVATGAVVLAAAATGYFMYAPVQERPGQVALRELQRPAVAQVAAVDDTVHEAVKEVQKVEPKPEPLAKPALADVLSKHNMELGEGTHIVNFYKEFSVEDVQERYVILEEVLKSDEQMEKYERKYIERPVLEMYADFLNTAMAYAGLEGQADAEKAGAKALGETVAKRLENRVQQKRIKEKIGKERASELKELAGQFTEFAGSLPAASAVLAEEGQIIELPVVTPEELEEMKKAGEEPEVPVVILPDKTDEKPFDIATEMEGTVPGEFRVIDTPEKVNEFGRKAGKVSRDRIKEKFLMQAHLTGQIIEHDLGHKMSETRIMFMHLETMNAAILFAMEEGQGMAAKTEALNAFNLANGEVARVLGYKKMKDMREKKKENLTWLRNRAEELKNEIDNYNKNKDKPIPLPGSPALENGNGVPTAMPETVKLDRNNEYEAIQMKVFSDHGLSIFDHPLKIKEQMRGKKINSFERFVITGKLVDEVLGNPNRMDGLSKAEQFEMLGILADFLDATRKASNEPKYWPEGYAMSNIMLDSLAIDVSDEIGELRKKRKGMNPEKRRAHLYFPIDVATFQRLGEAKKEFDEQLNYEYKQKPRILDTSGE